MNNPSNKNTIFFPNLDALRFIAFFLVFVNHSASCFGYKTGNFMVNTIKNKYLLIGDLGVNFFFVLSGFLITFLLLKEKDETNKINIPSFYLRRVLRIWPLYFVVLLIGLIIVPLFTTDLSNFFPILTSTSILNKTLYIFFLGNFDYLINGVSNFVVGVLWSVSVEEQFYLFWPLLLFIIPRKHLTKVFLSLIIFSTLYRLFGTGGFTLNLMLKYSTLSCLSDLSMGALFAQMCSNEKIVNAFINIKKHWIDIFYCIGFLLIIFRIDIYNLETVNALDPRKSPHILKSVMPVIYSLFFAFILIEQVFAKNSIYKLGDIPVFTKLGKISYGLYCFHMIAMFFVIYFFMKSGFNAIQPSKTLLITEVVSAFVFTVLLSWLSYRFIEKRFLLLKDKMKWKNASS